MSPITAGICNERNGAAPHNREARMSLVGSKREVTFFGLECEEAVRDRHSAGGRVRAIERGKTPIPKNQVNTHVRTSLSMRSALRAPPRRLLFGRADILCLVKAFHECPIVRCGHRVDVSNFGRFRTPPGPVKLTDHRICAGGHNAGLDETCNRRPRYHFGWIARCINDSIDVKTGGLCIERSSSRSGQCRR